MALQISTNNNFSAKWIHDARCSKLKACDLFRYARSPRVTNSLTTCLIHRGFSNEASDSLSLASLRSIYQKEKEQACTAQ